MSHVAGFGLKQETTSSTMTGETVPWQHAAVFVVAAMVVISHRLDVVLTPQLWAEDGTLYYADAYNLGWWNALLQPAAGYFCLLPRLTAALAQLLPLAAAPLLFNLTAIFFNAAPASFLFSSRCAALGPVRSRLLLAFLYLALPNSFDISANITNAHSYLALLVCLIIMVAPASSPRWRFADAAAVLLGSLTGPFVLMLWPLAAIQWGWRRRSSWTLGLLGTMTVCALLQGVALLRTSAGARVPGPLGATPLLFAKIVASQVFAGAIVGRNAIPYRHSYEVYAVVITIVGIVVWVYALVKGPWELKLMILFGMMLLAAGMLDPMVAPPKWPPLMTAWGVRYWFMPMLAFVCALVWMAGAGRPRAVRLVATAALLLMSVGIVREWRHPAFVDLHFTEYARQFSGLPKSSSLSIPLNPPGWSMTLVKK